MKIAERLAAEFKIGTAAVARTLALLDAGAAIPFIARYRKEQTGGLAEHRIREIARRRDGRATVGGVRLTVFLLASAGAAVSATAAEMLASGLTPFQDEYVPAFFRR